MKKIVLNNGLTVILNKGKQVHSTYVSLLIKYGSFVTKIKKDNKIYSLKNGIAHFIEHYLIEHSQYGNLLNILGEKKLNVNGLTNSMITEYYFRGIKNINYGIEVLLNAINNINENSKDIEITKNAILQEIRISKDNNNRNLFEESYNSLFKNYDSMSSIGEYNEVKSIKLKDVLLAYNSFYTLDNEILIVSGNLNENEILNHIKKITKSFKNKTIKVKEYFPKEPEIVNNKLKTIKGNIAIPRISINYKIKFNYTNLDKYKLDYYLMTYLKCTLGRTSILNEELFNNNLIDSYLNYRYLIYNDYIMLSILVNTYDDKIVIQRIVDTFKNIKVYENDFDLEQKNTIMDLISKEENHVMSVYSYLNNILKFNYDYIDNVSFIKSLSYSEYRSFMTKINFSNYSVVKIIDDNKNTD